MSLTSQLLAVFTPGTATSWPIAIAGGGTSIYIGWLSKPRSGGTFVARRSSTTRTTTEPIIARTISYFSKVRERTPLTTRNMAAGGGRRERLDLGKRSLVFHALFAGHPSNLEATETESSKHARKSADKPCDTRIDLTGSIGISRVVDAIPAALNGHATIENAEHDERLLARPRRRDVGRLRRLLPRELRASFGAGREGSGTLGGWSRSVSLGELPVVLRCNSCGKSFECVPNGDVIPLQCPRCLLRVVT